MALSGDPKISEETRQRVEQAKEALNYRPLRKRIRKTARPILDSRWMRCGLIVVFDEYGGGGSQLRLLSEIAHELSIKLEITVIDRADHDSRHQMLEAAASEVEGMLFYGHVDRQLLAHAKTLNLPAVLLGQVAGDPIAPIKFGHIVTTDHQAVGQYATRCLIEAGHERIGYFISVTPEGLWYERCLAGYKQAMNEAGLPIAPGMIQLTGPGGLVGMKACDAFCQLDELPTAYFSPDLQNADQFIDCMAERGHVIKPENIVIGTSTEHPMLEDFDAYPMILENQRVIVQTALNRLRSTITNREDIASKMIIPFETKNLPLTGKSRS